MTPTLARTAFRFRSAHELMHVIQQAYIVTNGLFTESTANWAADFALPDIEPGDTQFRKPYLPLDCSYGSWESQSCGNGYTQWLFFEWLSERFGSGFVNRLWTLHATSFQYFGTTPAIDRQIMTTAIANEPGPATLSSMYVDYMAALWDPTLWATTAVATEYSRDGAPLTTNVDLSRSAPNSGSRNVVVDHFGTRYIRLTQNQASAPGDRLHVTVTPGTGAAAPRLISGTGPGLARSVTPMTPVGGGKYEATVSLDAAGVSDVVLPLINDTATDDLAFTYSAQLLPAGAATPPTNDLSSNPLRIQPRTDVTVDVAYAGGSSEAPDCDSTADTHKGVWFVVQVDAGPLTVDPRGSDFDAGVAVYDITLGQPYLWRCSPVGNHGLVSGSVLAREFLIYVGRTPTSGPGHTLRLTVDANPNTYTGRHSPTGGYPVVSRLSIRPKRFVAAAKGRPVMPLSHQRGGARLSFSLDATATMVFDIMRRETGRRVGGTCVKVTKGNRGKKKCMRLEDVVTTRVKGLGPGDLDLRLTGRQSPGKALKPGHYWLWASAENSQGTSPSVTADFIVKPRH